MTHEWITHRLPTKADGDGEGDVRVPRDSEGTAWWFQHYSLIVPGQPWWSHRIPERVEVEPAPALVVAVGQQWRRRNGEVVTITQLDPGTDFPICVGYGCWHRADGTICLDHADHDLIELVSGPAPAPTRKVVQIAAAENDVCALCDDGTVWSYCSDWAQLPAIPQPGA
jgi:hypothetical protein